MKYMFSGILALILLVSCAGVPKEEYATATALRERATRYEAVKGYESASFDIAEENYLKAKGLIETKKELKVAKSSLIVANENYNKVLNAGMPAYANDLTKEIDKSVADSTALKAQVALETKYIEANNLYEAAKALVANSAYDDGLGRLEEVKTKFDALYQEVKQKHDESLESVAVTQDRLKKLEQMAAEIDSLRSQIKK